VAPDVNEKLHEAVLIAVSDVERTLAPVVIEQPDAPEANDRERPRVLLRVGREGHGGVGVDIDPFATLGERVQRVASVVQDEAIEYNAARGRPGPWPACPRDHRKHSMYPHVSELTGNAVWVCTKDKVEVCAVGSYTRLPEGGTGRLEHVDEKLPPAQAARRPRDSRR
jgi:hypothetical protein